jgi:hypothetical protein
MAQRSTVSVPFVGCKSDGQADPIEAPQGKPVSLVIESLAARQLSWYTSAMGAAVLGPRGWYCFAIYGSSGDSLFVAPEPLDKSRFFSDRNKPFTGPVIEFSRTYGDGSGSYEIAKTTALVFPGWVKHWERIFREFDDVGYPYRVGPFPSDEVVYKSNTVVEYVTPAHTEGLGTRGRMKESDQRISGVAILIGDTPDLWQLNVRLPENRKKLAPVIIRDLESRAEKLKQPQTR